MARRRSAGEGSIFFRESKGLWVAKITLPDGSRKEKSSRRQSVVREWAQTSLNAQRQGLLVKDDSMTVAQFLDSYMGAIKDSLRPKTVESYSYLTRMHIVPVIGKLKLSTLRPDHLQALYTQKLESGLSRRTVQYIHSILHKTLHQALRWGLVYRNVADLVDPPRPSKRPPTVYTAEQINLLLNSVTDPKIRLALELAIKGGFREGEVLGIHIEDIQLSTGTINVNHAVQYQLGRGVVITQPKTEKSRRPVKLPLSAVRSLRDYLNLLHRNQGLLFTTNSGRPINPRFLIKKFKQATEAAGLPEIRFHDLRHSHNTLLLLAGTHPKLVQERNGHSSIVLTMDTYSHVLPNMQDEVAEKLEKVLSTPGGTP